MDRLSILPAVQSVRAIFDFKGENNDELCFKEGDIITVTRTPEGGWYEGTLNDMTGWFPSNYVEPIDTTSSPINQVDSDDPKSLICTADNVENRKMVIKEIIDSEMGFIQDITNVYQSYLVPLHETNILPGKDAEQAIDAVLKVIVIHSQLLESLKALQSKSTSSSSSSSRSIRVGGAFMEYGLKMKEAHARYCSIHPKFVSSIERRKYSVNMFMKSSCSPVPRDREGSVQLTSGLSAIFTRLDKYPALLQELQRYTDEGDPDRGDTQRAGFLYRDFVSLCLEIRRLKEMEIEVMMGNIKNWPSDGPTVSSLGQVIHMGPVIVTHSNQEGDVTRSNQEGDVTRSNQEGDVTRSNQEGDVTRSNQEDVTLNDRYLVLFEKDLLLLSVSEEMTSFSFETKLKLENITLPRLPLHSGLDTFDGLDTFELLVTKTDGTKSDCSDQGRRFVFQCSTSEDVKTWVSKMYECKRSIDAKLKSLDQVRALFESSPSRSHQNGSRSTPTGRETPASMSTSAHANIYDEPSVCINPSKIPVPQSPVPHSPVPHSPMAPMIPHSPMAPMIPHSPRRQPNMAANDGRSNTADGRSNAADGRSNTADGRSNSLKKSPGVSSLASKCSSDADISILDQFIESYRSNGQKSSSKVGSSRGTSPLPFAHRDNGEQIDMRTVMEELRLIRHEIKQVKLAVNLVSENLEKETRARKRFEQFVTRQVPF